MTRAPHPSRLLALFLLASGCAATAQSIHDEGELQNYAPRERDYREVEEDRAGGEAAPSVDQPRSMARTQVDSDEEASAGAVFDARYAETESEPSAAAPEWRGEAAAQSWRRVTGGDRFASVSLGGGNSLELRRVRVNVSVEGFRARTVVDHIFYNPHARTIEGTFRYPLPPEASVSSYAMFLGSGRGQPQFFGPNDPRLNQAQQQQIQASPRELQATLRQIDPEAWAELRVGRIVRAEQGREVYEQVTRRRVDPALVEEVAPNTFEARVFPIQANGFHRVIVAYEQALPRVGNELEYTFPVPGAEHGGQHLESFSFDFEPLASRPSRSFRYTGDLAGGRYLRRHAAYHLEAEGAQQGGAIAFRLTPEQQGQLEVMAGTNPVRDERHFAIRLHAERLPSGAASARRGGAEQAVFLVDTSLSAEPDRFNIDVALMREILARNANIQRFNVITFDAGARWLSPSWLSNDDEGREDAEEALASILLEGATDLDAALRALAHPPMDSSGGALDVFLLSDGAISWGERDLGTILTRFRHDSPFAARLFAYRTGVGAEDVGLLTELTRLGAQPGAVFNCLSSAAVPRCAEAHRAQGFRVERASIVGDAQAADVLIAGGAATLAPGAEVTIVGKMLQPGSARLILEGSVAGAPAVQEYRVSLIPRGSLSSRAWAEVAIAHLLATGEERHEELAVALSQHYRVPSRLASFLVLETDAEYEQYDLGAARRSVGRGELAAVLRSERAQGEHALTSHARVRRVMALGERHHHLDRERVSTLLDVASRRRRAQVPLLRGGRSIGTLAVGEVPRTYRRQRTHEPDGLEVYRIEGERRRSHGTLGAAIRALSSGVENAPRSAEVLRSVGYTLVSWGARAEAAELFFDVLAQRPYEPQSYRDLAIALWSDRPEIAALMYQAILEGQWDGRFRGVVDIAGEEYALLLRDLGRRQTPGDEPLVAELQDGAQRYRVSVPDVALRVTMSWNTDNTDIDLWVTDPNGEKCYYAHRDIASGGQLLADVTQGFGPERFQSPQAARGEYLVQAHYYGNNGNRLLAETYVLALVARDLGTPRERVERHVVRLAEPRQVQDLAHVRF